jgi:hypothetical protein
MHAPLPIGFNLGRENGDGTNNYSTLNDLFSSIWQYLHSVSFNCELKELEVHIALNFFLWSFDSNFKFGWLEPCNAKKIAWSPSNQSCFLCMFILYFARYFAGVGELKLFVWCRKFHPVLDFSYLQAENLYINYRR